MRRTVSGLTKFPESPVLRRRAGDRWRTPGVVERVGRGARRRRTGSATTRRWRSTLDQGELREGERVRLVVDRRARHATAEPHGHAPAARRAARAARHTRPPGRLGGAPGQAALRLHARHSRCRRRSCEPIEDRVNDWVADSRPVRALHTTRTRAEELGAMALFGEKYGDEVRMVEVEESRASSAEGPTWRPLGDRPVQDRRRGFERRERAPDRGADRAAAVELLRERDARSPRSPRRLRTAPRAAAGRGGGDRAPIAELERERRRRCRAARASSPPELAGAAVERGGVKVLHRRLRAPDGAEALLELSDRLKSRLARPP